MNRIQITWVVKTAKGQIKGPYSTAAILRMIAEGAFTGQEMISKMPDGQWTYISQEITFYDKLLEALEGVVEFDPVKANNMEAETVITVLPTKSTEKISLVNEEAPVINKINFENIAKETPLAQMPKNRVPIQESKSNSPVIELRNIAVMAKESIKEQARLPIFIVVAALMLVAAWFFIISEDSSLSEKIVLLAPKSTSGKISDEELRSKFNASLKAIQADTVKSYIQAQDLLVAIIESSSGLNKNTALEVRGLLCYVYKELWPYSRQNAEDIRTISSMTQGTRSIDVISPHGQLCEVIKVYTSGRYKEARAVLDATLESTSRFSLFPILYQLKGELLESEKDYAHALPYFEKAYESWTPKWIRPQISIVGILAKTNRESEALGWLKKAIDINPNHKAARYMYGTIEFRKFRKADSAISSLKMATEISDRAPSGIESEGLFAYSEILSARNKRSDARRYAEKAFSLNPNNPELRQLVLKLGGNDKVDKDKSNTQLLFLGDEYMRQGDCLAAQAEYKAAFDTDPKSGTAAMKAAKCLWQLNQTYESIDWLKKAIRAEPDLISAYVLQADYLSQRYDFAAAFNVLSAATRLGPNNYEVLRGLATLEYRKNSMRGALNYGFRSLKVYDGDIENYILLSLASAKTAVSITPMNKKEIERKDNAARDAMRYATKAIEIDSTNADAQITYAQTLALINGVDIGINYLLNLSKKYSYSLEYKVALGDMYRSEDRFTQSKEIYERVVDLDPKNKKAWLGLGESYKALALNEKALSAFLSAAILDPSDGEALFQAGKLYFETNRFQEAIQQFKRVQSINPKFPRTWYYIGRASLAGGDFNSALEAAKEEKKFNPNTADPYILMAEVFSARRQYSDCAAEYAAALRLRSVGAEIYVKAAQCYRQAGSTDIAENMLAMAAARESGFAEIYREQGAIYDIKGDVRAAIQAYKTYLGLSPNAPDRGEVEAKIRSLGGG